MAAASSWDTLNIQRQGYDSLLSMQHPALMQVERVTELSDESGFEVAYLPPPLSLEAHLTEQRRFSQQEITSIFIASLKALQELHAMAPPFVHGNISPASLHWNPTSKQVQFSNPCAHSRLALPEDIVHSDLHPYLAPEQIHGRTVAQSDLYSLALTLLHVLLGENPQAIKEKDLTFDLPEHYDEGLVWVLESLLEQDLELRPESADEALEDFEEPFAGAKGCFWFMVVILGGLTACIAGVIFLFL